MDDSQLDKRYKLLVAPQVFVKLILENNGIILNKLHDGLSQLQ